MRLSFRRRIRGQWWTIVFARPSEMPGHEAARKVGGKLDGETCSVTRTIWINRRLRGEALLDTLAHEWMHAEEPSMEHRKVWRRARQLAAILKLAERIG